MDIARRIARAASAIAYRFADACDAAADAARRYGYAYSDAKRDGDYLTAAVSRGDCYDRAKSLGFSDDNADRIANAWSLANAPIGTPIRNRLTRGNASAHAWAKSGADADNEPRAVGEPDRNRFAGSDPVNFA